jgi:putative sterol carrier protein
MSDGDGLFSATGIAEWCRRLNGSSEFARAAAGWHGTLVLVEDRDPAPGRRTWITVDDGACTEARVAMPGDEQRAEFVLAASPATWAELVSARTTPATAAMGGRLRLVRGELMRLIPHARAAAALLATAARGEAI